MTAPAKSPMLPPCPVCGKQAEHGGKSRYFYVDCPNKTATHTLSVNGHTQAEADARWRRLAGGGRNG